MARTTWRRLEVKHLLNLLVSTGEVEFFYPINAVWDGDKYGLHGDELNFGPARMVIKLFATKESSPIGEPCFAVYNTQPNSEQVEISCHLIVPPGTACGYPRKDVSPDPSSEELRLLILDYILKNKISDEESWLLRDELEMD